LPRVHFDELGRRPGGCHEAVVPRPEASPAGYTPVIYMTEWLTLRCRGDWSSRAVGNVVRLRFADADDLLRVVSRFGRTALQQSS